MVGNGVGVIVGVGTGVGSKQGSAQHGRSGGMHTQVPQQQLHCFPTGQSFACGLHSLTVGKGVGAAIGAEIPGAHAQLPATISQVPR